jgi:hypothetical protein
MEAATVSMAGNIEAVFDHGGCRSKRDTNIMRPSQLHRIKDLFRSA